MVDDTGELTRLTQEVHATVVNMQRMMGDLQGYLREQVRMQSDFQEMRVALQSVDKMLRGDGISTPMQTRLLLVEQGLARLEARQATGRDFWFKVLASLTVAALIGLTGVFFSIYVFSKGPIGK
jgi:hypothetical protein